MLKKLLTLTLLLLTSTQSFASVNNVTEEDGSPSGFPWKVKFANGSVTDNGDGTYSVSGGSGAPTDADYLVGTTNASLSAEIVVGTSPGGELGNTWASPTIDDSLSVATWTMTGSPGLTISNAGTSAGVLQISEDTDDGSNYTRLTVGAQAGDITYILPTDDGDADQVLSTNGTGTLDWVAAGAGGGLTWSEVTGTTQAIAVNTGYIANNAVLVTLTLPDTAALGSLVRVIGKGAGGWKIAQNASEQIIWDEGGVDGTNETTIGVGGYVASSDDYDAIELLCTVANLTWTVLSSKGNITLA